MRDESWQERVAERVSYAEWDKGKSHMGEHRLIKKRVNLSYKG